jgi:hypothetical protein
MASGGGTFDRAYFDRALSGLSSRVFVMNNVHEDAPAVLESRWAMSYLRGPLTRDQIKALMAARKAAAAAPAASAPETATGARSAPAGSSLPAATGAAGSDRPVLPPEIPQFFLPAAGPQPGWAGLDYEPMALGVASVGFSDARLGISVTQAVTVIAAIDPRLGSVEWSEATPLHISPKELAAEPEAGGRFLDIPPAAAKARSYDTWAKSFKTWLGQTQSLELLKSRGTGLVSAPGESERDFRVRIQTAAREQRDRAVEKLRQKYASKLAAVDDRIRRAEQVVDRESAQAAQQKLQTAVSMGATVLGALLGRKKLSASTLGKATTAARGMGRTMKESEDIGRAQESLEALRQQKADFEAQVQAEVDALGGMLDPATEVFDAVTLKPKRTDLSVQAVGLAWVPAWVDGQGRRTPAYR